MIQHLDPVHDGRWRELILRHPSASLFHTPEWLDALRLTYGFVPVAYTTDAPSSELTSGVPFCHVDSWVTGRRLVSLPFSDHCQPLVDGDTALDDILDALRVESRKQRWRYVQIRPLVASATDAPDRSGFWPEDTNYHFRMDISPDRDALFRGLRTVLRYDVRRAERSDLRHVIGRDAETVAAYFRLHVMTRSRHGVPPQPLAWFRNLAACLGPMMEVHLLVENGAPIAGLVTILFRDQFTWKYSASDPLRNGAGLGKLLMWQSILHAKELGATTLDMGRCDRDNIGLAQFKERWGARPADLVYLRFPSTQSKPTRSRWISSAARSIIHRLPPEMLAAAGRFAYPHVG